MAAKKRYKLCNADMILLLLILLILRILLLLLLILLLLILLLILLFLLGLCLQSSVWNCMTWLTLVSGV